MNPLFPPRTTTTDLSPPPLGIHHHQSDRHQIPRSTRTAMDWYPIRRHPWLSFFMDPSSSSVHGWGSARAAATPFPRNHVHWTETPESHLFAAHLPGTRKEEIRVEVEDSRYLIMRTERGDGGEEEGEAAAGGRFVRKFRLPGFVDLDRISAEFLNEILVVAVPRTAPSRRHRIRQLEPADLLPDSDHAVARAA